MRRRNTRISVGSVEVRSSYHENSIIIVDNRTEFLDGKPTRFATIDVKEGWVALELLKAAREVVTKHREQARLEWKRYDDALKETS